MLAPVPPVVFPGGGLNSGRVASMTNLMLSYSSRSRSVIAPVAGTGAAAGNTAVFLFLHVRKGNHREARMSQRCDGVGRGCGCCGAWHSIGTCGRYVNLNHLGAIRWDVGREVARSRSLLGGAGSAGRGSAGGGVW